MSIIRVVDVETGPDPIESNPGIIEYGYCDLVARSRDLLGEPCDWDVVYGQSTLINPERPIPPETSAIHHIVDEDVRHVQTWKMFLDMQQGSDFNKDVIAFAAHGAKYEIGLLGDALGPQPWVCTYKAALHLWADAPSFNNNALRYFLKPEGLDRGRALPAHRAGPDAYVTAFTLREALNNHTSLQQLIEWSTQPALLPRCKIGNFRNDGKGTPWEEVDSGFLHWVLGKDFDEDTKFTVRHHLEQREIDQRLEVERQEMNRQYRSNGVRETPFERKMDRPNVYHATTENPDMIDPEIWRMSDKIISPSGRVLKDRHGEASNPLVESQEKTL